MADVRLRLYTPVLGGATPLLIQDVDLDGVDWSRSIRAQGGYWQGEFTLTGDKNRLARMFYEYLGFHLMERSGGQTTFEGMLYEMDLTVANQTRRRSLDMMDNYVLARYAPDGTTEPATTTAASNDQSIARYGRKEELLLVDNQAQAKAENERDTHLTEYAWPKVEGVKGKIGKVDDPSQATLDVAVCGYVFTANWRYITPGDGSDDDLSAWVHEIVETDCTDYLLPGAINSNTRQVKKETGIPMRAWDVIAHHTQRGDADNKPWRAYVDNGRRLHYKLISITPQYYLIDGELYTSASSRTKANPWQVKPGVCRDLTYPVKKTDKGTWLADGRDFYMSQVSCGTGAGLSYQADYWDESEILAAQAEYEARQEQGAGGSGGAASRLNWKRRIGLKEGTEEWERALRATPAEKRAMIEAKRRKGQG